MTCRCGVDDGPGITTCTRCADAASEAAERAWIAENATGLVVIDRPVGAAYAEVWHGGKCLSRRALTDDPQRGVLFEDCIRRAHGWLADAGLPAERIRETRDLEAAA